MTNETKVKIDYATSIWLKKIALKHLGFENMNHLRDRFEGQSYLNTFLLKSYSEILIEKTLNITFINRELKEAKKGYTPQIVINGHILNIISFETNTLPKVRRSNFDFGLFVSVNIDNRTAEFLGFLDYEKIISLCDANSISPIQSKLFIGTITDLEELKPVDELLVTIH